jgi:hypothetical protein
VFKIIIVTFLQIYILYIGEFKVGRSRGMVRVYT